MIQVILDSQWRRHFNLVTSFRALFAPCHRCLAATTPSWTLSNRVAKHAEKWNAHFRNR